MKRFERLPHRYRDVPPVTGGDLALHGRSIETIGADVEQLRETIRQAFGPLAHGLVVECDPEDLYDRGGGREPDFDEIEREIERDITPAQFRQLCHEARLQRIEAHSWNRMIFRR